MPYIPTLKDIKRKYNITKPKEHTNTETRASFYKLKLWKNLSSGYRMFNPLCKICEIEGKVTPSEHTHHLVSFMKGNSYEERLKLLLDMDNLIAVCPECHGFIHGNRKLLTQNQLHYLTNKEYHIYNKYHKDKDSLF